MTRRGRGRLSVALTAVLITSLSGCAAPQIPAASDTTSASPSGSTGSVPVEPDAPATGALTDPPPSETYAAEDPRSLGDAIFTDPPDPLTLAVATDDQHAVTQEIGTEGGVVSTVDSAGNEYTLTIPAGALPLTFPITLAPITNVGGFPEGVAPEESVGASIGPDGLVLGEPATLEIKPAVDVPEADAYGFSYQGTGAEAGFHFFDRSGSTLTFQIDHFSGYQVSFPIFIAYERPSIIKQFMTQSEVEARLASEVAAFLMYMRQRDLVGVPATWTIRDFARWVLAQFRRLVISPRVAVADRGCAEASAAMEAYLNYQRQRQLLGVAEDPEFDLVGAGLFVPAALVDVAVRACFEESYEYCKTHGAFPWLAMYYLSFFHQVAVLGAALPQEHVTLAQDYMRRCGRWRVRASTTIDDPRVQIDPYHNEATREFHIQWERGEGQFGFVGSKIVGTGPVDQTQITRTGACSPATISAISSGVDSSAQIKWMAFNQYFGPTLTGDPIPPEPAGLHLDINLGRGLHDFWCNKPNGSHQEGFEEEFAAIYVIVAQELGTPFGMEDLFTIENAEFQTTITKGWLFHTRPFRAVIVIEGRWDLATGPGGHAYTDGRLEVVVEHEPQ